VDTGDLAALPARGPAAEALAGPRAGGG